MSRHDRRKPSHATRLVAPAICLSLSITVAISGCGGEGWTDSSNATLPTDAVPSMPAASLAECPVMLEEQFGGVYAVISPEDFDALGFAPGDALDVTFSNGYELRGIPYYTGYDVMPDEPLVVAYPGRPYIDICVNFGDSLWETAGLSESDTVDIRASGPGRYRDVQDTFSLAYPDEQADGMGDAEFTNWRSLAGGRVRDGRAYRSASPVTDEHGRVEATNRLMADAGIGLVIDLSDSEEKAAGFLGENEEAGVADDAFRGLWEAGKVDALGLDARFFADGFRKTLSEALSDMAGQDAPCLIHCVEGKDGTGFACALLEGLCGASYDEIADDYMATYENYYGITADGTPERYAAVRELYLDPMIRNLAGVGAETDLTSVDLEAAARRYLSEGDLTGGEIDGIVAYLCN